MTLGAAAAGRAAAATDSEATTSAGAVRMRGTIHARQRRCLAPPGDCARRALRPERPIGWTGVFHAGAHGPLAGYAHDTRRHVRSAREIDMKREQLTEKILDIKRDNGWTWKHITAQIGGVSPVLVVGALLGQMKLVKPLARKAAA